MSGPAGAWRSRAFRDEVRALGLPRGPGDRDPVTEDELSRLPVTAQRYLRFMGVVGRPPDWSFLLESVGRFRMRPDGPWMACRAWQYNSALEVARVFRMSMRFGAVLPTFAHDTYVRGHGRMLGKVLDLFTVADGHGPELDVGELVTWLDDAVLVAPAMLLGPRTTWSAVDDHSFDLRFTDGHRTVGARVTIDGRGAPVDFSTTDRYRYDPEHPRCPSRDRWSTPVEDWQIVAGRPLSMRGRAVWHLPAGEFVYADFRPRPESLAFNLPPPD